MTAEEYYQKGNEARKRGLWHEAINNYTDSLSIRNQTLYVHLTNPALRADLSMLRSEYVRKLNEYVGSQVIADIRFH